MTVDGSDGNALAFRYSPIPKGLLCFRLGDGTEICRRKTNSQCSCGEVRDGFR